MTSVVGENAPAMQSVSPDVVFLWNSLRAKMLPETTFVTIAGSIFDSWNLAERDWVLAQFRAILAENVIYVRDWQCERFFLGREAMFPPETLSQDTTSGAPLLLHPNRLANLLPPPPPPCYSSRVGRQQVTGMKLDKATKILRPPNAFILYRKAHHESVKAAHPGIHNNQISIIIGTQWQKEDAAVRAEYRAEALQLKMEHMLKYPDYQYQPRKSSELKRRMTKKKAAVKGKSEPLVTDMLGLGSSPLDHDFSEVFDSWIDINQLENTNQPSAKHGVRASDLMRQVQSQNDQQSFAHLLSPIKPTEVSVGENEWLMSFPREYEIPWAVIDANYPHLELDDKYNPWI